jgi:hypothetical protein
VDEIDRVRGSCVVASRELGPIHQKREVGHGGAVLLDRRRVGAATRPRAWLCAVWLVLLLVTASVVLIARSASASPIPDARMAGAWLRGGASPSPFGGVPLAHTGLRLLVAGNPPFTLAVDSGAISTIQVPGLQPNASTWVRRVGRNAALVESPSCADCLNGEAFFLRPGDAVASPLGGASDAAPARNGDGLWLLRHEEVRRCTIRQVGLDGGIRVPDRAVPCGSIRGQEPPGIILSRASNGDESLLDPTGGHVLLHARQILGATGHVVLTADRGGSLALHDLRTGSDRKLPWPSAVPELGYGVAQPHGRLIAVAFADPPPARYLDVWVFDTATRRFRHMPGRLAEDAMKFTTITWTDDGRLILLTRISGRDALAVWRPGERRIASGYLHLPAPHGGQAGMVAW